MKNLKILTTTNTYREMTVDYKGFPILMRHYHRTSAVHIRVNDDFARANGFDSMEDIYRIDPMMRAVEWVDAEMFGAGMIAAVIGPVSTQSQTIN